MAEPTLSLAGVSIGDDDIDTLSTDCGLSLNLIAYLFKGFALAKNVRSSGTLLVDPETVMRMASCCATRERIASGSELPQLASANVVLIPVHDVLMCREESHEFHWTLVVFRRHGAADGAPQFDVYGSGGTSAVRAICELVAPMLLHGGGVPSLEMLTMETQEAVDRFDDGMYLVSIAELVCAHPTDDGGPASDELADAVTALTPARLLEKRAHCLRNLRAALEGHVGSWPASLNGGTPHSVGADPHAGQLAHIWSGLKLRLPALLDDDEEEGGDTGLLVGDTNGSPQRGMRPPSPILSPFASFCAEQRPKFIQLSQDEDLRRHGDAMGGVKLYVDAALRMGWAKLSDGERSKYKADEVSAPAVETHGIGIGLEKWAVKCAPIEVCVWINAPSPS